MVKGKFGQTSEGLKMLRRWLCMQEMFMWFAVWWFYLNDSVDGTQKMVWANNFFTTNIFLM